MESSAKHFFSHGKQISSGRSLKAGEESDGLSVGVIFNGRAFLYLGALHLLSEGRFGRKRQ